MNQTQEPWVSAEPVAQYLGVTRAYVLKLALLGRIPAHALPPLKEGATRQRWRFRISEIDRWMQERSRV